MCQGERSTDLEHILVLSQLYRQAMTIIKQPDAAPSTALVFRASLSRNILKEQESCCVPSVGVNRISG